MKCGGFYKNYSLNGIWTHKRIHIYKKVYKLKVPATKMVHNFRLLSFLLSQYFYSALENELKTTK